MSALVARRHALGMTGEQFDARAGWADRYTGKIERPERPQGRLAWHFDVPSEVTPAGNVRPTGMADIWLLALGLRLVLVDEATADAIGAVPALPAGNPRDRVSSAGGDATDAHRQRRLADGRRSAMSIQAYEAADRATVLRQTLRAAVTDHVHLSERPELKAKAEEIESRLAELADLIGEAR